MSADITRLREARPEDDLIRPIPSFEFEREPPIREWMVEGCFPKGTVAMLSGDGGVGKSLLCMQLATSAVMGREWLGMRCSPGNALMLACEDDSDELNRRHRPILRHYDIEHADLEGGLHLVARVGQENTLADLDRKSWRMQETALCKRLLQYCRQHGITYVVIDTATQTFAGNQNDERQVVDFINILRRIAVAIQGLVLLTKHPSLSGRANGSGESGNTAWSNSVRSRLYMRETAEGTILSGMKSNYGRKLEKICLEYRAGVFVTPDPAPRKWYEED